MQDIVHMLLWLMCQYITNLVSIFYHNALGDWIIMIGKTIYRAYNSK
jgi:hypothetical protein